MSPLSLFSFVDVNFIKYSRELTTCVCGVYVFDLLKILGGVCPEGKQSKSNIKLSTLIIHRKVTCCQRSVRQPQKKMKIGIVIKFNTTGSNMTFIFNIDKVHINYS